MDHFDLIARAQRGDQEAFEQLFRTCYAPVYRFALTRMKSPDEAEDIAQDVFVQLLGALPRYRRQGSSLLPYLLVIARNKIIDQVRKRRPECNDEELWKLASEDPTPEEAASIGAEAAYAIALLNTLTEADAAIVRMKYFDGFSTAEIAQLIGKREDSVRQILSRSIRQLRSLHMSRGSQYYGDA